MFCARGVPVFGGGVGGGLISRGLFALVVMRNKREWLVPRAQGECVVIFSLQAAKQALHPAKEERRGRREAIRRCAWW